MKQTRREFLGTVSAAAASQRRRLVQVAIGGPAGISAMVAVPEPAALSLLALGLGVMAIRRRMRRGGADPHAVVVVKTGR